MSQSIITLAFETYKAQQEAISAPVELNEFVLALVPNQDPTQPIDRNEGLPPQHQIVHVSNVTQGGFVNPNAVVYSLIMDTRIGDFEFNWVGLRNKQSGVLASILHIPTISKFKSVPGVQNGNSVTRSILMSYQDAKNATGITVDASTWQIDFTARLFGMDEAERLANLDVFGQAAFLADGFKVKKSGSTYLASIGRGYVGGLRCHLDNEVTISGVSNSSAIYLDASWQGQLTSQWQTVFEIKVSKSALSDYVDADGYQHYVTKIADINSVGNVVDTRHVEGFSEHLRHDEQATQSEAESGTNSNKWMSSLRTQQWWNKAKTKAQTVTAQWTFSLFKLKSADANNPTLEVEGHRSTLTNLIGSIRFKNRFNGGYFDLSADGNGLLKWVSFKIFHEGNRNISDSVTSTSSTIYASLKGVKAAYDLAASKMTQAVADGRYLGKTAKAVDSSKLNGATESVGSAANTIVKRDGSGDVSVRLLRSSYADDATISGGLVFRKSVTDNYHRVCNNVAAIRTWLSTYSKSESDSRYLSKDAKATLTDNDGHGNANLTFNHKSGVPQQNGSSYRLETSTDTTTAKAIFEMADDVVEGTAKALSAIWEASTSAFDSRVNLYEKGQRVFSHNNRNISDSVTSTSSNIYASLKAVKTANDLAASKMAKDVNQDIEERWRFKDIAIIHHTVNVKANEWITIAHTVSSPQQAAFAHIRFCSVGGGAVSQFDIKVENEGSHAEVGYEIHTGTRNGIKIRLYSDNGMMTAIQVCSTVELGSSNVYVYSDSTSVMAVDPTYDPIANDLSLKHEIDCISDNIYSNKAINTTKAVYEGGQRVYSPNNPPPSTLKWTKIKSGTCNFSLANGTRVYRGVIDTGKSSSAWVHNSTKYKVVLETGGTVYTSNASACYWSAFGEVIDETQWDGPHRVKIQVYTSCGHISSGGKVESWELWELK